MQFPDLDSFIAARPPAFTKGPSAMIFAEDGVEIESTLYHHLNAGFKSVVLFGHPEFKLDRKLQTSVIRVNYDMAAGASLIDAVNAAISIAPGAWLYYCYNAEYLFFPFCETRSIGEMMTFHGEERRDAMLTYVIDLYASNLKDAPNAVSLDDACLDKSGYYAQARLDPEVHNHPKERQLDFFGGLRWRFEEFVPPDRRRIDRISLFRARPGLVLRPDFTFDDEEYNTYSCKWHNNLTAAVCSFRVAKALKRNPGSTHDIKTFHWHNSESFDWTSQQLMDLGLMEPGQWF
ncbi:hypothetical protein [Pseudooceanicola sp. MF1-13]|uniref:hypothetical protein n=1 Tax=Pseudooceanicola sp. MF1-13 TaxID=3379095 RepID=UPI0038911A5D